MLRHLTPRAVWRCLPGRRASRAESAAVARLLAACRDLDVAPAPLLEAWGRDSRGRQERRLARAARYLQAGGPPAGLTDAVPGLLHDEHATAIRFGGQTGLVGPAVRAVLAADTPAEREARLRTRRLTRTAVAWGVLTFLVSSWMAFRVGPWFKKILDDFDSELPAATRLWLETCDWFANLSWLVGPLALFGLALWFSPALRGAIARPFTRRRRAATAVDLLAVAAAAGRPIPAAAATLAGCETDGRLARRLWRAAAEGPPGAVLAQAGLLTAAEGRLLDSTPAPEPATLARIAADRRNVLRRRGAVRQGVIWLGLLALASGFVFWTALAFVTPVFDLTEQLAGERP